MQKLFFSVIGLTLVLSACNGTLQKSGAVVATDAHPAAHKKSTPIVTKPEIEDAKITLAAVGDIMLGGSAEPYLKERGYDWAFDKTRDILQQADIAIGNLETPLTNKDIEYVPKTFRFKNAPDKTASALKNAGFDLVTLANNHSLDQGVEGLRDTFDVLQKYGIAYHGAGLNLDAARQPVIVERNNIKIGFLAYSNTHPEEYWATARRGGTAFGAEQYIREDVSTLAQRVDVVVVSFHWGQEKSLVLRDYQKELAHAAVDAGAKIILGHHPHVLQGVECYKNAIVFYSLGNFAFGSFSPSAKNSAIAVIDINKHGFVVAKLQPINIDNFEIYFQPTLLNGIAAQNVTQQVRQLANELNTKSTIVNNDLVFDVMNCRQTGSRPSL
ncbi:MAG: CapA family protein [Gammaproteobacteria bacterium]|nr:CapA family protein [Gammaproteobacteria bacterium]